MESRKRSIDSHKDEDFEDALQELTVLDGTVSVEHHLITLFVEDRSFDFRPSRIQQFRQSTIRKSLRKNITV